MAGMLGIVTPIVQDSNSFCMGLGMEFTWRQVYEGVMEH